MTRFPDSTRVSYVGRPPPSTPPLTEHHLGHITKQGSTLLRFALGQAAAQAARMDVDLRRAYFTIMHRRGRPKAKVAVARKLLVRLFIMLRDQIDYDEFRRCGRRMPPSLRRKEVADRIGRPRGMRSSVGVLGVIHGLS